MIQARLVSHVVNRGASFRWEVEVLLKGLGRTLTHVGRFTNEAGGVLTGEGGIDISQSTFINQGDISPGARAFYSEINVNGDLLLDAQSTTNLDVYFSPEVIRVDGAVDFGGVLNVRFLDENGPTFDFERPLFTYTSSSGSFNEINLLLPDKYSDANATIEERSDTLMLMFSGYNVHPVAIDDSVTITEGDTILIDVKANDFDPLGDSTYITVRTTSRVKIFDNGTPDDQTDDLIQYTSTQQTGGEDVFNYTLRDNNFGFASGIVVVTIEGVDDSLAFVDYPFAGGFSGLTL